MDTNTHYRNEEQRVHVRWMVRKDFPEVLKIEQTCFEFPWQESDFQNCLRQRNCIGMVAELDGSVIGFMIYEVPKNKINLLNIAVSPEYRRQSVARQMVAKLIGKLASQRRSKIVLEIRETNLPALIFFRSIGFRAIAVLKNYYEVMNEDAYVLQYQVNQDEGADYCDDNTGKHAVFCVSGGAR